MWVHVTKMRIILSQALDLLSLFFVFFQENRIRHFMQIVLHEKCPILFSWKNKKTLTDLSSAELD